MSDLNQTLKDVTFRPTTLTDISISLIMSNPAASEALAALIDTIHNVIITKVSKCKMCQSGQFLRPRLAVHLWFVKSRHLSKNKCQIYPFCSRSEHPLDLGHHVDIRPRGTSGFYLYFSDLIEFDH